MVLFFEVGWSGKASLMSFHLSRDPNKARRGGVGGQGCLRRRFRLSAKALRLGHCCVQGVVRRGVRFKWRQQRESAAADVGEEMGSGSCRLWSCKDFVF